jgi:hypothetical protein
VAITSPSTTTCTLSLDLTLDQGAYFGNWEARCPDGTQGNGITFVTPTFSNQVAISALALRSTPVFGGCGWASVSTREGSRLRGDFGTPQNCSTGPVLSGRIELTKR